MHEVFHIELCRYIKYKLAELAWYISVPIVLIIAPFILFFEERAAWKAYKNIPESSPKWRVF